MAEHFDVVVIGAGISGIGAGYHLQTLCPDRSYVILEGRQAVGGTWDLFRYPGVRSDSDMHTLGYSFRPWTEARSIVDGASIRRYIVEAAAEYGIDRRIRFGIHVDAADWSSDDSRWTVRAHSTANGEPVELTCTLLFMCTGYYSYQAGHTPEFPGIENFTGLVVHPQHWPDDLDESGKRVVVIGSGATAMTIVPAMAERAAQVTMLQRSPTWVVSVPDPDPVKRVLRAVLPDRLAGRLTRKKNIAFSQWLYRRTRTHPHKVRAKLLKMARKEIGADTVAAHFTPDYNPWDQRLCLIPNGDLYDALNSGRASVVTDTIERFTETGIRLASGAELSADIVVTATGLTLVTPGEMSFTVDGRPVDFADTFTYKGVGYSDVPNLLSSFGYINASWTLRSDLIARFACALLNHLRDTGTTQFTPRLRPGEEAMRRRPFVADFPAGYITRAADRLPKQGDREPWIAAQHYATDQRLLSQLDDGVMQFSSAQVVAGGPGI